MNKEQQGISVFIPPA